MPVMTILTTNIKLILKLKPVFLFLQILLVVHISFLAIPHALATESTKKITLSTITEPLILAESASEADYKSFLNFSKSFHSLTQEYLNKQNLNTEKLKKQIKMTQDLYFQGKILKAQMGFINIAQQKWNQDWTKQQRAWIYFSFLRLSQIATHLPKKYSLIKEAIAFAPDKRPDSSVFNPPFLKLYLKLHTETKWSYITDYLKLQNYEKIIINGKVFAIAPSMKIPVDSSQQFRLSLVSNKNAVYSNITNYESFSSTHLLQQALVTGICDKFKSHSNYKYAIFFANTCIKNTKKSAAKLKNAKLNLFLKSNLTPLKDDHKQKKPKTIKKQTWVLITLGVIGAVIIGSQLIDKPSHKSGFGN